MRAPTVVDANSAVVSHNIHRGISDIYVALLSKGVNAARLSNVLAAYDSDTK